MKRKQPKILTLAILTTLTVLTWVSFEVWRSFTKQVPVQIDSQTLKPLDPTLDIAVIGKLKGEIYLPDSDARRGASAVSPTPGPTSQSTSSPTPAATTEDSQ